jgi:short-subunit dehydrogenase
MNARRAIVVGASSGIGREIAKVLSENGYVVGLAARRVELLQALQKELPAASFVKALDVARTDEAMAALGGLIEEMGGVELIVLNSGIGRDNPRLEWGPEKATIEVNVLGFTATATAAMQHFMKRGSGHLVGISSVAAIRGRGEVPAYGASKAFISSYLDALRNRVMRDRIPITITDIKPGFVDTDMVRGRPVFWCAPARKAAEQIYNAIRKQRKHAYITRRWRLIAWVMRIIPDALWARVGRNET